MDGSCRRRFIAKEFVVGDRSRRLHARSQRTCRQRRAGLASDVITSVPTGKEPYRCGNSTNSGSVATTSPNEWVRPNGSESIWSRTRSFAPRLKPVGRRALAPASTNG